MRIEGRENGWSPSLQSDEDEDATEGHRGVQDSRTTKALTGGSAAKWTRHHHKTVPILKEENVDAKVKKERPN